MDNILIKIHIVSSEFLSQIFLSQILSQILSHIFKSNIESNIFDLSRILKIFLILM